MRGKFILFGLLFFLISGVIATETFKVDIVPRYYSSGQELTYYKQFEFDAVSFDLVGYRNNYRNINNIKVNFTPSFLNEGIKISDLNSDGKIFASTNIFPIENFTGKVFAVITGKGLNEDMYSEVLTNVAESPSVFKNIGYSVDKNDYRLGLIIFTILTGIILFMLYKIGWKR